MLCLTSDIADALNISQGMSARRRGELLFCISDEVSAEKSSRHHEVEVSELNGKLAEAQRELRDITAQRNRLQQELNDATPRIKELESQLVTANKGKLALSKQLEDIKKMDDCEAATRTKASNHEQHIPAASCRSRLVSQWETPKFDSSWSQN